MKLAQAGFVLRGVWTSFKELLWTHILTSCTMAMTLFIFGGFLLVQENLQNLLKGWGNQIQVHAYLKNGFSRDELGPLLERIRSYPEVEKVRFISQDQAWEDFRRSLGSQAGVLEGLSADILPSSVELTVKPAYREQNSVQDLAGRLQREREISAVEYPQEWVEKLSVVLLGIQWAKWILGGVLFLATYLIVGSTVKLAIVARKDEIEIMQLVGAPAGLIKAPIVLEGILQGTLGGLLSILLLWLLFVFLSVQIPASSAFFGPLARLHFLDYQGMGLLLVLGWFMGGFGSLVSLRRFLSS